MDKYFEVLESSNSRYKFMLFCTSYHSSLNNLKNVEYQIRKIHPYECKMVFDLLLKGVSNSERFIEASFDGKDFIPGSFRLVKVNKKDSLRKLIVSFLNDHRQILEASVLNSVQKKMISKGLVI